MNTLIKREYDYALRICAYLAGRFGSGLVSISRLSTALLISRPFTTKIIYRLKNENIVKTVQGKDGGVYLSQAPENITVFNVLEAMGFDSKLNECLSDDHECPMEGFCRLHSFFREQERDLIDGFKSKKLSDVLMKDEQLKRNIRQTLDS